MRNVTYVALSANDDVSRNGSAIPANQLVSASFQAILSDGTGAGSLKIQASNDAAPNGQLSTFTPTNWVDIPSATATIASQQALVTIAQMCYQWVRPVFTQTTPGVGTVTVKMNGLSL